jgi:hypothetical protein
MGASVCARGLLGCAAVRKDGYHVATATSTPALYPFSSADIIGAPLKQKRPPSISASGCGTTIPSDVDVERRLCPHGRTRPVAQRSVALVTP